MVDHDGEYADGPETVEGGSVAEPKRLWVCRHGWLECKIRAAPSTIQLAKHKRLLRLSGTRSGSAVDPPRH